MVEPHAHGPDGHIIVSEPSPADAEVQAVETVASADVEVARIAADRDVAIAKIAAKTEEAHDETEVEALRAEIRGIREVLDRIAPPVDPEPEPEPSPEPVPVIVDPEPEPAPDMAPPDVADDDGHQADKPKRKNIGLGMW